MLVALRPVPPGVETEIFRETAPEGTVVVIFVLEFTVKVVAATPPNFTPVACEKLMPVIVTCDPTVPLPGLKLVTVGIILKFTCVVRFPLGSSTVMRAVVEPAVGVAVMNVLLVTVVVAAVLPNRTAVAVLKF